MQYTLWAISFVSLWLTIIWLSIVFLQPEPRPKKLATHPSVTIAVPAYNGGARVLRTLESIKALAYPAEQLQTIVVNDGSTDNTAFVVQEFMRNNPHMRVKLVQHSHNKGKGAALNTALEQTTSEFFACMDCDSRVEPDALQKILLAFDDAKVAAVIPTVKVDQPHNGFEYLQRVEYVLSNLVRQLLATMGTLFLTHGVLSVFRVPALREVGGFDADKNNITEDLEIAMRLRKHHYITAMASDAIGYTHVPQTFNALWRQRIRWFRGFLYNHHKFKELIGRPAYGLFGMFQLPLNLLSVVLLLATVTIISYGGLKDLLEFVIRSVTIKGYFWNHVLDFPTLKEFLLGQNVQIVLPIFLGSVLGIWLIVIAHQRLKEKILRHIGHIWFYFLVMPYLTSIHWMSSITHEILKTKRKW